MKYYNSKEFILVQLFWIQLHSNMQSFSVLVAQSCPTLPHHGLYVLLCPKDSQGKNTGVGAISFSQPRDRTCVSCIAGRFLKVWATREAQICSHST